MRAHAADLRTHENGSRTCEPDTVEAILNFRFLILYLKEWRRSSNSDAQADCEIVVNVDSL